MDNLDSNNSEPIVFDDDAGSKTSVSHAPLDLGGASGAPAPAKPAVKKPAERKPVVVAKAPPLERITGIKTFFAKLHVGAIDFLEEQIANWLKENPDISIKRTNEVTGEVQGKKSEPNIIITAWY